MTAACFQESTASSSASRGIHFCLSFLAQYVEIVPERVGEIAALPWEVCKFRELSAGLCAGIFAIFAATIAQYRPGRFL